MCVGGLGELEENESPIFHGWMSLRKPNTKNLQQNKHEITWL